MKAQLAASLDNYVTQRRLRIAKMWQSTVATVTQAPLNYRLPILHSLMGPVKGFFGYLRQTRTDLDETRDTNI